MAYKTNYRQERAQKTRAREAKQEEKIRRREEAAARRKALREGEPAVEQNSETAKGDRDP